MGKTDADYPRSVIVEQLEYLRDVYELLRIEESGIRVLEEIPKYKKHFRRGKTPGSEDVPSLESFLDAEKKRLKQKIKAFQKKMRQEPEKYPMGAFCRARNLNAFERHVVATASAVAVYGEYSRTGITNLSIQKIVSIYYKAPAKRLEAQFYFDEECRLVREGIVEIENGLSGRVRGAVKTMNQDVEMTTEAYAAVMGKPAIRGEKSEGRRSRGRTREDQRDDLTIPKTRLNNVILPESTRENILQVVEQVRNQGLIFEEWGLGKQVRYGRSPSMLFAGLPGTGKTLAAEAVAGMLNMKLMVVKSSDIISCWWGESEKRAAAAFRYAKKEGALLLFDEADSYFHRRVKGNRSVDESANRTVNTFLDCLEEHELPVIFTTNRPEALDPALERRVSLKVIFEPPGENERVKIWKLHLPRKMPLAGDVDIKELAARYALTGGQIKNAAVGAARSAVHRASREGEEPVVCMSDLDEACRAEISGSEVFGTAEKEIGFTGDRQVKVRGRRNKE